jgi:LCP family protein required for cell wall assembly
VRTTLKRGHGRAAAADGNGSGWATPPPDVFSPTTIYSQPEPPKPSRLRRAGRVLGWLAVALIVVAVGLGGGIYLWWHESVAAVQAHSPDVIAARQQLDAPLPDHAAIALVIGYDHRVGEGNAPARSDTLMLVRTDPATKTISMLSFPRDLSVPIRCRGRDYGTQKINAAYAYCQASGSVATVKALTHLPINYLITVNFRGFKKVVNTLGGVWVDVDRRYLNTHGGSCYTCYATINIRPGYQRLTGGAALDYVRFRHTDSDFFRIARQQLFVQAIKEQFASSFSFTKIPRLVGAITSNVEVAGGGGKTVPGSTILRYANFAYTLPPGHFFQPKISGLTGGSEVTTDPSNIEAAVHEFVNPDVAAVKQANTVALGGKIKQKAPKPAQTSIVVLNGNGVEGSAGNAKYLLGQRGYRMLSPPGGRLANAPTQDYFHSKVYYRGGHARAKAAALALARVLAPAEAEPIPGELRSLGAGTMLVAVVGRTFHNSLTPLQVKPQIKHEPAHVISDGEATLSYLRQAQRKVPFKLEVPNVIESGSIPDPELPIRTYTIDGDSKAVRLVFRRPGINEYWGIQETDWEGAPALGERNFHRVLKKRPYDLYYHGQHLHMVVLHENGSTYWVVNTLLDSLSNETMLAIAKGLGPLNPPKPPKGHARKQKA